MLVARGFVEFAARWARATVSRRSVDPATYRGRIIAGVTSHNQRRVVDALVRSSGDADGEPRPAALVTAPIGLEARLPLAKAYAAAARHAPDLLRASRRTPPTLRRAWAAHASEYALTTGFYVACRRWLVDAEPAAVLVANDHVMRTRAFVEAARDEGIPTVYVQHAAVTPRFPSLRSDLALLDGVAAAAAYISRGPSHTRIFLTGSPMHDSLVRARNGRHAASSVGLCLNLLDRPEAVMQVVETLGTSGTRSIEVRTHPRDQRDWGAWLRSTVVEHVHGAREECIQSFLARVSVVVAGDSGVHLEAALAGVPSVYAAALGTGRDGYGFVAAGLARVATSGAELRDAVAEPVPASLDACRRFDATVGTPWSGRAGALVRSVLGHVVRGEAEPPSVFAHVATIGGTTVHALEAQDLVVLEGLHSGSRP